MTPTRAIQSIIDAKKDGTTAPPDAWNCLKNYKAFTEYELNWILNASAYAPEILWEEGMEQTIQNLLEQWKARLVPHKF